MNIGVKIKALAESKKISAKELGEKIGRTRQAVYDIYSGKVSVNVEILDKISKAFGMETYQFFIEDERLPQTRDKLKSLIIEIMPHVINNSYISFSLFKELSIDILKNVYEGNGLVSLVLEKKPEPGNFNFLLKYKPLKNKLTDKELGEFSRSVFGKVFTEIKTQLDSYEYGEIIGSYIDELFNNPKDING